MMGYELNDDEVAIIIRPSDFENHWDGGVHVEIASSDKNTIPHKVMAHIMNVATMMSAFLDVAAEYPDIYDIVEEHRNYLMGIDLEKDKEDLEVIREGNVYTLTRWTKTKGNA